MRPIELNTPRRANPSRLQEQLDARFGAGVVGVNGTGTHVDFLNVPDDFADDDDLLALVETHDADELSATQVANAARATDLAELIAAKAEDALASIDSDLASIDSDLAGVAASTLSQAQKDLWTRSLERQRRTLQRQKATIRAVRHLAR